MNAFRLSRGIRVAAALAAAVMFAGAASATDLAVWTFETSLPATAGPHAAEGGIFGGDATGFHSNASVVYSNPAGNGSAESFSSNFWSVGDYYQFKTSTTGYESITIGWDQTRSSTGPGTFDLEYSLDGVTFTTLLDDFTVLENSALNGGAWSSGTYVPNYTFAPVAGPAALDDQAAVYFRLTNTVTPGGTAGTNRVDNVVIAGTLIPEPASLALLALGALGLIRRR
jgi:hypothetical protein